MDYHPESDPAVLDSARFGDLSIAPPGSPIDPGVPGAPDAPGFPDAPSTAPPATPAEPPPAAPEEPDDGSVPTSGTWHSAGPEVL